MPKHTVTKPVHHNGKLYRKGAEIELTAEEAKPLIEIGHVAKPEGKKSEK